MRSGGGIEGIDGSEGLVFFSCIDYWRSGEVREM
jgi:hypothetical protein